MNSTADAQQQTAASKKEARSEEARSEEARSEEARSEEARSEEEAYPDENASEDVSSEETPTEEGAAASTDGEEEAAAAEEGNAPSALDALRAERREREEEREALNDRLLRTAAELQNVRRRAAKEQRRRATSAKSNVLRPMLDVMDDLERTLAAAGDLHEKQDAETAFQSLRDGVEMVAEKFQRALASQGVEPIDAEGQPFDENEHEAMIQQPAPEGVAPGTVLGEVRTGYRMGEDRILRHSRVVVASESGAADAGEDAEENEPAEE